MRVIQEAKFSFLRTSIIIKRLFLFALINIFLFALITAYFAKSEKIRTESLYTPDELSTRKMAFLNWRENLSTKVSELYDQTSLISKVHNGKKSLWDQVQQVREPGLQLENYYESFAPLIYVTHPCRAHMRLGSSGDGGKIICKEWSPVLQRSCIVYSLGSNNDFSFERDIKEKFPHCKIFTFDCTIGEPDNNLFSVFFPWCIASEDFVRDHYQYKTISTIMLNLGHSEVSIMKMDIEAYEHRMFNSWSFQNLPRVLLFELHTTSEPVPMRYRRKAVGELALEYLHLTDFGYRLVYAEKSGGGAEMVMLRL